MAQLRVYRYVPLLEAISDKSQIALMARSDEHAIAAARVLHSFYGWRTGFEVRDGARQVYVHQMEPVKT